MYLNEHTTTNQMQKKRKKEDHNTGAFYGIYVVSVGPRIRVGAP